MSPWYRVASCRSHVTQTDAPYTDSLAADGQNPEHNMLGTLLTSVPCKQSKESLPW